MAILKNISKLEHSIADKTFHFFCDSDSSLSHVKESLYQFLAYICKIEEQNAASAIQQQENNKAINTEENKTVEASTISVEPEINKAINPEDHKESQP